MLGFALLFLSAFVAMEGIAYLMHKHLMHGALWVLQEAVRDRHAATIAYDYSVVNTQ